MTCRTLQLGALAIAATIVLSASAQAQIFRAYLASDGDDANPCTLPQPCRLLPRGLTAVADGGEIWMLDSANYNTAQVNITKSVTIQAIPGAIGSLIFTTGSAVSINTPDIRVTLRNLVIAPLTSGGVDGIQIGTGAAGATINVESCQIVRVPFNIGIRMLGNATLYVVDSILRDNWYGILVTNGTTIISRSQVLGSGHVGVQAGTADPAMNPVMHVDNTVISKGAYGLIVGAAEAGGVARAFVTRSVASANTYNGFHVTSEGAATSALLEVSESVAHGNGSFGMYNFGATLRSAGNNRAEGNGTAATQGTITVTASH